MGFYPAATLVPTPPAYIANYIGLPYLSGGRDRDGLDCWGLLRLFYDETFFIELPSYDGAYADAADRAETAQLLASDRNDWRALDAFERPHFGDGVLLKLAGRECHVGVMVATRRMLHIEEGVEASHEPLDDLRWNGRIAGVFRHKDLD